MKKFVVVDIDGTIADGEHRVHHLLKEPKEWDEYYSKCEGDKPIWPIVNLVKSLDLCGYSIVFCSGRREETRAETSRWLDRLGLSCFNALLLRKQNDRRHDTIIKPELLSELGVTTENTAFILEDRNSVVKKWRELGFTCLQVAEGDF